MKTGWFLVLVLIVNIMLSSCHSYNPSPEGIYGKVDPDVIMGLVGGGQPDADFYCIEFLPNSKRARVKFHGDSNIYQLKVRRVGEDGFILIGPGGTLKGKIVPEQMSSGDWYFSLLMENARPIIEYDHEFWIQKGHGGLDDCIGEFDWINEDHGGPYTN